MMKAIRWGDNDRYFGPLTFSRNTSYRYTGIVLGSGDGDDYPGCRLRVSFFGWTMIAALPAIIKPWRKWVDTSHYEWSKSPGGYWDTGEREYGFTISDGHLSVGLGRVTNDSSTEQRWGYFLPWTQWRHVRHAFYDEAGNLFHERCGKSPRLGSAEYEADRAAEESCPALTFEFLDFDGERLTARTRIEQREWLFGVGWFKWLSLFRKRRVSRSLDIHFSGETGKRKGSWKGGTIGHSIGMKQGEAHESAFRRYCAENSMTFVGPADPHPRPRGR